MAITLHHLNASRSIRILWLLEEAGIPYTLVKYQRDAQTHLAPAELKAIHSLGKSPVIEDDGRIIAESGAITEYLIQRYAPSLAPAVDDPAYCDYLQWIHFAESSAMVPVLLKIFNQLETNTGTQLNFLQGYADAEFNKVFDFLEQNLSDKTYIVGDSLTGADIMLGFVLSTTLDKLADNSRYPAMRRYVERLHQSASWQRAAQIEAESL